MPSVHLEIDTSKAKFLLHGKYKRAMEKSITKSINNTAFEIRSLTVRKLPRWLNLTRDFLPRSVSVSKARAGKDEAIVGFLERAALMPLMEKGGVRRPKSGLKVISVPTRNIRRRTRGNTPRNILQRPNTFSARINNTAGIWRKLKRGLKLLYHYHRTTSYRGNETNFIGLAEHTFDRKFNKFLAKNWEEQVRKARDR